MDYEPTNPSTEQEVISTIPPVADDSKEKMKIAYISIGAILVLVAAGIVTWYFLSMPANNAPQQPAAVVKTALPAITDGNTNTDITNDINKIPSDSAAFAQDQNSINKSIKGL